MMPSSGHHDRGLQNRVAHIAAMLKSKSFPTGERALLRRMNPAQPPPIAFYKFALNHLPENWERNILDWLTLVAGIAQMSPNAHRSDCRLGKALAETGFSEPRLERLLTTRGNTRRTLLLRTSRFLAAKVCPFNWVDAAQLLLIKDEKKLEDHHRRIAKDYYQIID